MQEHFMRLRPGPFDAVRSGAKRVEMRLMDEKRRTVGPGDAITFTNTVSGETLRVSVVFTEQYSCFEEVYRAYPPEVLGYRQGEPCSPTDCCSTTPRTTWPDTASWLSASPLFDPPDDGLTSEPGATH